MSICNSFGGDEFLFVEVSEFMSLTACCTSMAITRLLRQQRLQEALQG